MTLFHCTLTGETLIEAQDKVAVHQLINDALPKGFHVAVTEIKEYGDGYIVAKSARDVAYDAAQSVARAFADGLATEAELDKALTACRVAGQNLKHQDYLRDQKRALEGALAGKGIFIN